MEHEPQSLQGAVTYFSAPDNCMKYRVVLRCPKGVACPTCGNASVTYLAISGSGSIPLTIRNGSSR